MMWQPPPFCIQLEATEGCNLACTFCGIHGIRPSTGQDHHVYRFLTLTLAEDLARRIAEVGWTARLEFAMHGEPTLNPELPAILHMFRSWLPTNQLMLTTNGVPLLKPDFASRVDALFDAGLTILALDNYVTLKERVASIARTYTRVPVYEYPDNPAGNPHRRHALKDRCLTILRDITLTTQGTHTQAHLGNHGGAAAPREARLAGHRCAKPFRELSIRWDGHVAVCCNDWRGEWKIGHVQDFLTLEDLWQAASFQAARRRLYYGLRDRGPCDGCTHMSFRPGLLPDLTGQGTIPAPFPEDDAIIEASLAGPSYTPIVARPWERS